MTLAEMNRRLATLDPVDIAIITRMIGQGYGVYGIRNETSATLKQINAVFELVARKQVRS